MATGNVPITAGSGTLIRVVTNAGVDSGANQQVFSLASSDGKLNPFDPDGTIQVSPEPTALFLDDFSGSVGLNWTTGGTAPVAASGAATTSNATTVSLASYMRTNGTFLLRPGSYLRSSWIVQFETTLVANNSRWFGYGQNQAAPTAAAPVLNGAVFILDYTDGSLKAATYSAGTRNNVISLTKPTDNAYHRYEICYRQSVVYWIIDGVTVATVTMPNLSVSTGMYNIVGSANFTTAPSTGPAMSVSSSAMGDQSGTNRTISDGINPWLQATVKPGSTAPVATDLPLVVIQHPSQTTPALASGGNIIGAVHIGSATVSASYVTSTTTNTATIAKASAGQIHELVITNTSAAAQWVKIYNLTAVTLGTSAAVASFPVAAGVTLAVPFGGNGLRMTTGIAYSVTGGAGLTDNTAGAGGVAIVLSYV